MTNNVPVITPQSFLESLKVLHKFAEATEEVSVRIIFAILAGKGYAALFMILSLPFCFPIQIPGFSTPFGVVLAFLALRFSFAKHLWWPEWILNKEISSQKVSVITQKAIQAVEHLKKITHPRLTFLTHSPILHPIHGLIIFILALLLLLPLPIPFTNMLTALPIFCIGVGLLEDDGVFIILGYVFASVCFVMFTGLIFLGKSAIHFFGSI